MNVPNDEQNLSLFKYMPESAAQLLIQTNESQEYVQIPNSCDDLLLSGLEDGTVTWALGGLPVLLSSDSQQFLINQLTNGDTLGELQSQQDSLTDILGQPPECSQEIDNKETQKTDTVYPLEDRGFLTESGLFITNEVIDKHTDLASECALVSNDNETINSENTKQEESVDTTEANEIQSSDISSQETFIDVNGMLVSKQSILNLNSQDFLFNIQDLQSNPPNIVLNTISSQVKNNKTKRCKRKIGAPISILKSSVRNDCTAELGQNCKEDTVRNFALKVENSNPVFSSDDPTNSLIKILNLDGSTTFLNIDGTLLNKNTVLNDDSNIVANDSSVEGDLQEAELAVDEEPDSTVSNDVDDTLDIDDLATVITAYKCKKCEFTCNDKKQFLSHFKQIHLQTSVEKPVNSPQFTDSSLQHNVIDLEGANSCNTMTKKMTKIRITNDQNVETIRIIYDDEDINDLVSTENVTETNMETILSEDEGDFEMPMEQVMQIEDEEDENEEIQEVENTEQPLSPEDAQTLSFILGTNDITGITIVPEEEIEKKIMRVKRKKNYRYIRSKKVLTEPQTIAFVSNLLLEDNLIENNETDLVPETQQDTLITLDSPVNATEITPPEKQLIYLCSQCGTEFLTVSDCKLHMIQDHKLCAVDENNTSTTEEHADPLIVPAAKIDDPEEEKNRKIIEKFLTTDILKPRRHKCARRGCQFRFAKLELLLQHDACHVEGSRTLFQCTECGENQPSWRACSIHMWRNHKKDIDLYTCPLCNYKGSTQLKIKHHLKIHSDEREYVCPDCGRGFKQPSQLRNHKIIHLDRNEHELPQWYLQKKCDKCGKLFADSKCLKKHVQAVHSKLKPFICNVCGHSCARKAMLQMHLRQHTGEKPYSCKLCVYKTGDHNSLRRHTMRHNGTRPYKCPHCDYTAIQSNSYKNHLASKHPGMSGSFNCTLCPFKTVSEEAFASHKTDHEHGLVDMSKIKGNSNMFLNTSSSELSNNNDDILYNVVSERSEVVLVANANKNIDVEDDETQNCFLSLSDLTDEQTVDTGGITIPADPDDPEPINM